MATNMASRICFNPYNCARGQRIISPLRPYTPRLFINQIHQLNAHIQWSRNCFFFVCSCLCLAHCEALGSFSSASPGEKKSIESKGGEQLECEKRCCKRDFWRYFQSCCSNCNSVSAGGRKTRGRRDAFD